MLPMAKRVTKIEPFSQNPELPELLPLRKEKVAAYARVSTGHEDQQTSLVAQTDYYKKKINANPEWEFAGIYADDGLSGTSYLRREAFTRMVQDCRDGKITMILTKSISRFARNTIDSIKVIRELKSLGIGVMFEKENIWTADFLTTKQMVNHGEVPQYFVEDNHEAIIEPELFDRVQDMIQQRNAEKHYSGVKIYSSKLRCGSCGGFYGSKVWHSNDRYRRVVWQCNAKFRDKKRCKTPHLTEEQIQDAFVRVMNQITTDRDVILETLRQNRSMIGNTGELEREKKVLAEQMNVDADAVQELIAENTRVAQDQKEYAVRYEALPSRFEKTKARYEQVTSEISMKGIQKRELGRFIRAVEELPDCITDFSEALWGSMVDHVTVYSKDNLVFTLTGGLEIKA